MPFTIAARRDWHNSLGVICLQDVHLFGLEVWQTKKPTYEEERFQSAEHQDDNRQEGYFFRG